MDETRPPASTTGTREASSSSSAGAWRRSTATTTAGPTCTSPAASEPAALYRNDSPAGGALAFTRLASAVTDLTAVTGAYPLDVDSDGLVDLVVLRVGEDVILRGRGDCRFERANELLGIDGGDSWTVAFSAMWEGSDALPTLAFGDYLDAGPRVVCGQPAVPARRRRPRTRHRSR